MSAVIARSAAATLDNYRAAFDSLGLAQDELGSLRREAFDRFLAAGFPTQRQEDWKYTNLRRLENRTFSPAPRAPSSAESREWIANAGTRIVLNNGHRAPALSSASAYPPGVTVLSLSAWMDHEPREVAALLSEHRTRHNSPLEELNLAFSADGVVVQIADDIQVDTPIYVVHQWSENAAQGMSHPRVVVRAGRNSHCTLIEQFVGPDGIEYFTNAVTTLQLDAGARLEHYRIQQESTRAFHIAHILASVQADADYSCHDVALGASLGRVGIATYLEGSGAHCALHGLIAPLGSQHLDAHTRIDHVAPRTTSDEDYRGVAGGRGRGVFNGKVIVRPDAQQIDARQSSRNLLLNEGAEIDTKPELEIYANDVKCSHGATTGQLDATALFYLRSRGLSESEARILLIRAFAESILATIGHAPVRSWLEQRLNDRYAPAEVSA
jgi:Fe-S cluster assembly protein SufD